MTAARTPVKRSLPGNIHGVEGGGDAAAVDVAMMADPDGALPRTPAQFTHTGASVHLVAHPGDLPSASGTVFSERERQRRTVRARQCVV
jgi:hypothetical protein